MQYRQLPPGDEFTDVEAVCRAVPRSPEETDDCCGRICSRTAVESREHASQWLVFLTGLGCVSDDGEGYYRHRDVPEGEELGDWFESSIFAVEEVLGVLEHSAHPLSPGEVLEQVDESTRRRLERAETGVTYVTRILEWATVFDRAERTGEGYTRPERV